MCFSMKNEVAIVTGASRGIGRAISLKFVDRGARVIACARTESALENLADEAQRRELSGTIEPRVLDVTDKSAMMPFVEAVAER